MEVQRWQNMNSDRRVVIPQVTELPIQAKEAINVLRGNIQMSGYDLKTIAITSALAHEGKSSIAFRLARSLANLGKRTVYLDCDIRNSMTIDRYDIQVKTTGLSEFLCGREQLLNIIYKTDNQWLDMIFAGAKAPNPSELISGAIFGQMMAWLRENYDYVIVDTPPVNPVIDGVLIAKQCDGTILVIENGLTERSQAVHAKQQLEYAGVKILGAVFNKAGMKQGRYGYDYGYGYGYGMEKEEKKSAKKQRRPRTKKG